ncbi:cilia- and flagella-associated protein 410-like [Littorina saxatilis]|uniref:cilia- and flagella-associated protein 410-like n=1 Tax=Littorina saxatilis TaxID=31220 RepID=UPI0038B472CB
MAVTVAIALFMIFWLSLVKKVKSDDWEKRHPAAIPVATASFILGFLRASQIQDASIVRRMPNLEVCSLSVNNLSSLEDFSHCTNLQELYIRKNRVGSLTDVVYLKELEKLRVLWLADNPCSQGDNYRMTVLRTLPNLQKLEEEEDSGVEASANHLQPERSKGGPSFGISVSDLHKNRLQQQQDSVKLSWEETNQIRAQLGLKPLPMSKVTTNKSVTTGATKARNANVLQSVLLLIRELDKDSLEVVHNSVQRSSSTDCSLATWCHTTTDGWLTAVSHSLTAAVRRGIYRAVT